MAEIPDDVVEKAARLLSQDYGWTWERLASGSQTMLRRRARAAGRVFVEWEREQIKSVIDKRTIHREQTDWDAGYNTCLNHIEQGIEARTNPDDCNPSDYT
jgi:hypothetical protein